MRHGIAVVAEVAAQFEDLALGGFEGLAQLVDLVSVLLFERGQLGGEGADDAARGVGWVVVAAGGGVLCCWACRCSTRWRIGAQR